MDYSACTPRAEQMERRGIRESGHARWDTDERHSLEARGDGREIPELFGTTNKERLMKQQRSSGETLQQ